MHLTLTINIEILKTNPPPHTSPYPHLILSMGQCEKSFTKQQIFVIQKKCFKEMEFSISSKHTLRRIFNSNLFPDEIIFFGFIS